MVMMGKIINKILSSKNYNIEGLKIEKIMLILLRNLVYLKEERMLEISKEIIEQRKKEKKKEDHEEEVLLVSGEHIPKLQIDRVKNNEPPKKTSDSPNFDGHIILPINFKDLVCVTPIKLDCNMRDLLKLIKRMITSNPVKILYFSLDGAIYHVRTSNDLHHLLYNTLNPLIYIVDCERSNKSFIFSNPKMKNPKINIQSILDDNFYQKSNDFPTSNDRSSSEDRSEEVKDFNSPSKPKSNSLRELILDISPKFRSLKDDPSPHKRNLSVDRLPKSDPTYSSEEKSPGTSPFLSPINSPSSPNSPDEFQFEKKIPPFLQRKSSSPKRELSSKHLKRTSDPHKSFDFGYTISESNIKSLEINIKNFSNIFPVLNVFYLGFFLDNEQEGRFFPVSPKIRLKEVQMLVSIEFQKKMKIKIFDSEVSVKTTSHFRKILHESNTDFVKFRLYYKKKKKK